ncbi:NAD-dependent epimerase/dehydratase family protein [Exiguobacterium acetylicum]|uniref:NAD-dependent epimerase/dehydratase family protein n=1 Tax=Exiguobacterium acetylicum TaxID=41170 RepID=UPI001CA6D37F|nr:NAD-dependent epimerase/dehydratase family protein [Exiguobacterium acetylicum]QZY86426.1 NAD-dependent epimerase/dehydratase family protein [Exiguobacterium acetylicum]
MKKVLVIGENSYVGKNFRSLVDTRYNQSIDLKMISVRDETWRNIDFSVFHSIIYLASIVHLNERKQNTQLYYRINSELPYEIAKKAKKEKVGQFIYISSIAVYGLDTGVIKENTPLLPKSLYGKSKLLGEKNIKQLVNEDFKVLIVRPPMIFGKDAPGNLIKLLNMVYKTRFFLNIDNQRSMIYIEEFCEYLVQYVLFDVKGLSFPQSLHYYSTKEIILIFSKIKRTKINFIYIPIFLKNKLVKLPILSKIFGNLIIEIDENFESNNKEFLNLSLNKKIKRTLE